MSRKRLDWDKVRRESRALRNGFLPYWQDGWASSVEDSDRAPRKGNRRQKKRYSENCLFHFTHPGGGTEINVPNLKSIEWDIFYVTDIIYTVKQLSTPLKEELLSQFKRLTSANFYSKETLKVFSKLLFHYCEVDDWEMEDSTLHWSLTASPRYRQAQQDAAANP
jgi:hypothetical protein